MQRWLKLWRQVSPEFSFLAKWNINSVSLYYEFSSRELAILFASYIAGAEDHVDMAADKVSCEIDQFRDHLYRGERPFTVLLQDGGIFEYWGYASPWEVELDSIDEIAYTVNGEHEQMSATFWSIHSSGAIKLAEAYSDKLYKLGVLVET